MPSPSPLAEIVAAGRHHVPEVLTQCYDRPSQDRAPQKTASSANRLCPFVHNPMLGAFH
jgi:hypothetical protein